MQSLTTKKLVRAWDNDSRTRWTDASCGFKTILSYVACGRADIVAPLSECSRTTFLMSSEGKAHASRKPLYWIARRNRVS